MADMADIIKAGVPPRFTDATTQLALGSYFIFGPVGTGKTHTACALCMAALDDGIRLPKFRTMTGLFDELRSYDPRDPSDYRYAVLCGTGFLALDDMGKEKMTDWKMEQLFSIIDRRYSHELPTVITSNLSLPQLAQSMGNDINGQAIVSRVQEMCKVVEYKGSDRRMAK